jgi:hypothetical protein|mmetsp:Transcript_71917/g.113976  ORF Transcript_71917/g.113976 Transcript_71917/m.113976 type:complete len:387 (-) Transcript_71917:55-1215(-)
MKRSAAEAFGAAVPAAGVFQPTMGAMLDPKAYFAQFQQAALSGLPLAPPGTPAAVIASPTVVAPGAQAEEKSELQQQIEEASAVRCASIVKEKGANFTTVVAVAALTTMATKSSYKHREELLKQPHVRKLCDRVRSVLVTPPAGLPLDVLAQAAWDLVRFPNDVLGTASATLAPIARLLGSSTSWHANVASKILFSLSKAEVITSHKQILSKVVQELVRDAGRRVAELDHEQMINLMSSIAAARVYKTERRGEAESVRCEPNDEAFFSYASKRIIAEMERIDARILAEVPHVHNQTGIRDEKLFKAICPRIMAKQKELDEKAMAKCIKAYARFMIPLREEAQGFRTMAIVQKGDFIRPSDKPVKTGPKTYDKPQALYPTPSLYPKV